MKGLNMSLLLKIILFVTAVVKAKLPLCSEGVNSTQFCQVTKEYPVTPLVIKPWFQIMKIMKIHEDAKYIQVHFNLMLRWNDTGVIVQTSENKP